MHSRGAIRQVHEQEEDENSIDDEDVVLQNLLSSFLICNPTPGNHERYTEFGKKKFAAKDTVRDAGAGNVQHDGEVGAKTFQEGVALNRT